MTPIRYSCTGRVKGYIRFIGKDVNRCKVIPWKPATQNEIGVIYFSYYLCTSALESKPIRMVLGQSHLRSPYRYLNWYILQKGHKKEIFLYPLLVE